MAQANPAIQKIAGFFVGAIVERLVPVPVLCLALAVVSAYTYDLIRNEFDCEYRGKVSAKGEGEVDMYFVVDANKSNL
jgi:hypothetical protein